MTTRFTSLGSSSSISPITVWKAPLINSSKLDTANGWRNKDFGEMAINGRRILRND